MIKEWKPHKKQSEFASIPWTIKEALYGGGAGSAKTETLLMLPILWKLHEHARFKQVFMRRTFPELRNEVVPRARNLYRPFGAKFNRQEMTFTFPSGAMVFFGHCENEDDVHKYDSMEINLYTPDELTSFTEFIYLYIGFQRTRAPINSGLPAIIRAGGMPGGIGHTWVRKRFIDPNPKGGTILVGRGGNKRIYIHATHADNPYVDPAYSQSLEALPEAEKQAKKYGSWDAYLGQVFEEFRERPYPDEPANALHVIEPFEIPEWWPRIVALDWGYSAMTWVGFGAISPDKRLYIYRELHWKRTKIEEWAPLVKQFIDRENVRIIKVCKSAGQDRGQEHTIQEQIESALGRSVELTTNTSGSRVAGKMMVHEFLRWKEAPKIHEVLMPFSENQALWLLRNRGIDAYNSYLKNYEQLVEEPAAIPKLQIFNTCKELINSIKSCVYDKARPEDVMEFDGDDPYDGLRYLVDAADRYFTESSSELENIRAREELAMDFAEKQDWHRLFMRARALESQNQIRPVRMMHRARIH